MHDPLLDHLARWKPFTALVVGDFMLDEQISGDAERLSPDAPVPILHVRKRTHNPGGAANVCLDLAALKGRTLAFGVRGNDAAGRTMTDSLTAQEVDCAGIVIDESRPTTVKQNFVGLAQARHPQKMFRVDIESRESLPASVARDLVKAVERVVHTCDVVCIEDYNKGVCTEDVCRGVIQLARGAGKPVFVDPARIDDYFKYRGATVITPNRTEAEFATGLSTHGEASLQHNAALARELLEHLDLEAVVLTLDRHGALLLERGKDALAVPTIARQVYDVTGAGDMFLAALAAARANQMPWAEATRFANAAAGLEVEIFGVAPIPLDKIHHSVLTASTQHAGKLRTLEQVRIEVAARRAAGQRVVFTNGCFDVLHAGHVHLLDEAKKHGDYLIVATNTDEKIRAFKGSSRPVNTLEDRVRVLGGLAAVDAVIVFSEDTPMEVIREIKPDVLVKGAEYDKSKVVGAAFVESIGGRVVQVGMLTGASTTNTLKKMGDPRAEQSTDGATREKFVSDRGV